jgi:hypothetical protein
LKRRAEHEAREEGGLLVERVAEEEGTPAGAQIREPVPDEHAGAATLPPRVRLRAAPELG